MSTLSPIRFSVCVEQIFRTMPFEQRLEHVADQGFTAFEFGSREGKDMNITLALKMALRLDVGAFIGSSTPLADPAARPKFLSDISHTAALAVDLSCEKLIVFAGPLVPGLSRKQQHASIVEGLLAAADTAADAGVTLVLLPLNPIDHPDSFLTSSDEGFAIVREVNHPQVRLLFHTYHQQISEGNLTKRINDNFDLIGHIQVADVPGRHEPGTGEINFDYLFGLLREKEYKGYVGLDYTPHLDPVASLRAVRALAQ